PGAPQAEDDHRGSTDDGERGPFRVLGGGGADGRRMTSTVSPAALPRADGRRPDLVERVLVIRKYPTLGDLLVGDAKDPDRLPGGGLTVALHLASSKDHRALIVGEHPPHQDAKRRVRQLASCDEVAQDLIPAPVVASY